MNWPDIEGIVYSECDNPRSLLGGHATQYGYLIQVFRPDAVEVIVNVNNKQKIKMEKVDENGFFATLLPLKTKVKYTLIIENIKGEKKEIADPYEFKPVTHNSRLKAYNAGNCNNVYEYLGAHLCTAEGVEGVNFAVWAPNALRVSVVGDFNRWDGRIYPMERIADTGVFELFIPGIKAGDIYKFEIKCKGGMVMTKADPYAFSTQEAPYTASVVYDMNNFEWNDYQWKLNGINNEFATKPVNILQLEIGRFVKQYGSRQLKSKKHITYTDASDIITEYAVNNGYNAIELLGISEYVDDDSYGDDVNNFYAPTRRYGQPDELKWLVDKLHSHNIAVYINWNPTHFSGNLSGLLGFDGTCIYEHEDSRQSTYMETSYRCFNFGRLEVKSFLLSNAYMWLNEYHFDGIKIRDIESLIYMDYGKKPGAWVANIYGGNENLDALDFIKKLNVMLNKSDFDALSIADEKAAYPCVTEDVKSGGLGFSLKYNNGWTEEMLRFMSMDPIYRKAAYDNLCYSMIYNYSENFVVMYNDVLMQHCLGYLYNIMPESSSNIMKLSGVKLALGYMMTHPGKKLSYMGMDVVNSKVNKQLSGYIAALNKLYLSESALYEGDYSDYGFKWVDNNMPNETIITFEREDSSANRLLIVANFTPVAREKFKLKVNNEGKYKEILNSDDEQYGGNACINKRIKTSQQGYITVNIPPMGISVYRYVEA